ncbi:MAG: alkaline phosphatase family protein [Actinomycetota bacterium]|nr:alkaline phosphatase family protein [Actinomycetota bacterium]
MTATTPLPALRRVTTLLLTAGLAAAVALAPAAQAQGHRVAGLENVPHFDHVVVLTEENEAASTTFAAGSPAVYLNSLRRRGVFLPNYYGTGHVSLDNYIAMVSGQQPQPLSVSDCATVSLWTCVQPQAAFASGRHLGDQLDAAGLSWRSYQDGTTTPCFHGPYTPGDVTPDPMQGNSAVGAKNYADRHNPFIYFPNVIGNQARCAQHQRPIADLTRDLRTQSLPAFSFITPDTCNDGHDNPCVGMKTGGLVTADAWLRRTAPSLLAYLARHNGLLIINFDEGSTPSSPTQLATGPADFLCSTCTLLGLGGRTGAILISPRLPQGATVTTSYDHYSLLRSIEDSFGIGEHLNLAGQAVPMTDAFAGTRG